MHLKPDDAFAQKCASINRALCEAGASLVDLNNASEPHVTLYMTHFKADACDADGPLVDAVVNLSKANLPLEVTVTGCSVRGRYLFLDVEMSNELRTLHEELVKATVDLVSREDIKMPIFVHGLPEPLRTQKTEAFDRWGSPNAMSQFGDPHFTLAVANEADGSSFWQILEDSTKDLLNTICTFTNIGIGKVGPWGSVMRGSGLAVTA